MSQLTSVRKSLSQKLVVAVAAAALLFVGNTAGGGVADGASSADGVAEVASSLGSDRPVDAEPSVAWTGESSAELSSDWTSFVTDLGVDRANLEDVSQGRVDATLGTSVRTRSWVELPGVLHDDGSDSFVSDYNRHLLIPEFAGANPIPINHAEVFVWRGRSDNATAVLSFVNVDGDGWRLESGFIGDDLGLVRNISRDGDIVKIEPVQVDRLDQYVELRPDPTTTDETPAPAAARRGVAWRPAPMVVDPGNVTVDVLAVGFNYDSDDGRVSTDALAAKAATGITAFNTATEDSSSSDWVIDDVEAVLRGLMVVEVPTETTTTSDDMDRLDDTISTGVYEVSEALGVDAVGGFRRDYSNYCGQARRSSNVFVWQEDDGGCQDDEHYTFAHELAHLAWADHDYSMCDVTMQSNCNTATDERTLMGVTNDTLRLLRFSNPDHDFASGNPMGEAGINNHNNVHRIASYVVDELSSFRVHNGPAGGRYTALEFPERVLDTRSNHGIGGYVEPVGATDAIEVSVLVGDAPEDVRYVAINFALITDGSDPGTLRVTDRKSYADSSATYGAIRFKVGDVRAQTIVVKLSSLRTIWMRTTQGQVDVIADVVGYFSTSGSYMHELASSVRVFDNTISADDDDVVDLDPHCPSTTTAAAVSIVAVLPQAAGHLIARGGTNVFDDSFSTVNYDTNDVVIANATFVEVDNQELKIYSLTEVRVIVDLFGCFTTASSGGQRLTAYSRPIRRTTQTLSNSGHYDSAMDGGSGSTALTVADVTATITNLAHLWAYKPTVSLPATSNINLVPGDGISNMQITPTDYVSSANRIRIKRNTNNTGTVTVQLLQLGYFN